MKKKLLVLASGVLFLSAAMNARESVRWGVKAGTNFATFNTESSSPVWVSKTGVHAGLLVHIHLNKHWATQPKLVFPVQGSKNKI